MQRSGGSRAPERASHLRETLRNASLALASLLLCLLAAEVAARLLVDPWALRPVEVRDVERERGISLLPGSHRRYQTSEFDFSVTANRFGRRDAEWSEAELADPANVLVIGDSLVFGYGVEDAWTVPTLLEARAAAAGRPREFFNFGTPAAGPLEYRMLLGDALRFGISARVVVLGAFVGNDFYAHVVAPRPPRPPPEVPPTPPPSYLVDFLRRRASQSARVVGWMLTASRWTGLEVYDSAGSYIFLRRQTDEQRALFRRILELFGELQRDCEASGRSLLVAIFPNKIQVENGAELTSSIFDAERPNRVLLDYCAEVGMSCLDLLPVLRAEHERGGRALYFPIDRHLNQAGNEVAADAIFAALEREGALR